MLKEPFAIIFIFLTLVTTGGAVVGVATNENTTMTDKVSRVGKAFVLMPNEIDDFFADSIKAMKNQPDNEDSTNISSVRETLFEKYLLFMLLVGLVGVIFLIYGLYSFSEWAIGMFKPAESEQRLTFKAGLLALGLLYFLTGLSFLSELVGIKLGYFIFPDLINYLM